MGKCENEKSFYFFIYCKKKLTGIIE